MENAFPAQIHSTIECAVIKIHTSDLPEKIKKLRLSALCDLSEYIYTFLNRRLMETLIQTVCEKKVDFILQATSQGAIRDIMKPPRLEWTGNGLNCKSQYYIPEEELLMWAYVSPNNNLKPEAYARYMQVFEDVLGISVRSLMEGLGDSEIDFRL